LFFYPGDVAFREDRHVIDKNLSLLRPLGIEVREKEFIIPVS
ncbi:unnamed protein product, partial [marine sediment metagenome]